MAGKNTCYVDTPQLSLLSANLKWRGALAASFLDGEARPKLNLIWLLDAKKFLPALYHTIRSVYANKTFADIVKLDMVLGPNVTNTLSPIRLSTVGGGVDGYKYLVIRAASGTKSKDTNETVFLQNDYLGIDNFNSVHWHDRLSYELVQYRKIKEEDAKPTMIANISARSRQWIEVLDDDSYHYKDMLYWEGPAPRTHPTFSVPEFLGGILNHVKDDLRAASANGIPYVDMERFSEQFEKKLVEKLASAEESYIKRPLFNVYVAGVDEPVSFRLPDDQAATIKTFSAPPFEAWQFHARKIDETLLRGLKRKKSYANTLQHLVITSGGDLPRFQVAEAVDAPPEPPERVPIRIVISAEIVKKERETREKVMGMLWRVAAGTRYGPGDSQELELGEHIRVESTDAATISREGLVLVSGEGKRVEFDGPGPVWFFDVSAFRADTMYGDVGDEVIDMWREPAPPVLSIVKDGYEPVLLFDRLSSTPITSVGYVAGPLGSSDGYPLPGSPLDRAFAILLLEVSANHADLLSALTRPAAGEGTFILCISTPDEQRASYRYELAVVDSATATRVVKRILLVLMPPDAVDFTQGFLEALPRLVDGWAERGQAGLRGVAPGDTLIVAGKPYGENRPHFTGRHMHGNLAFFRYTGLGAIVAHFEMPRANVARRLHLGSIVQRDADDAKFAQVVEAFPADRMGKFVANARKVPPVTVLEQAVRFYPLLKYWGGDDMVPMLRVLWRVATNDEWRPTGVNPFAAGRYDGTTPIVMRVGDTPVAVRHPETFLIGYRERASADSQSVEIYVVLARKRTMVWADILSSDPGNLLYTTMERVVDIYRDLAIVNASNLIDRVYRPVLSFQVFFVDLYGPGAGEVGIPIQEQAIHQGKFYWGVSEGS